MESLSHGWRAELQCPNLIDLDSFAIRVAKRTEELTRFRIERVDPATRPREVLLLIRIALLIGPNSAGASAMPQGEWP